MLGGREQAGLCGREQPGLVGLCEREQAGPVWVPHWPRVLSQESGNLGTVRSEVSCDSAVNFHVNPVKRLENSRYAYSSG